VETIGDIGEFGLIERIARVTPSASCVVEGIGDDCAVVRAANGLLLVSCDLFLEGIHFSLETARPRDIGWKAAASALSDIAAMGGRPLCCVVSLACPADCEVAVLESVYAGLVEAAACCEAAVVGGDTARTAERILLDVTAIGEPAAGRYLTRKGAQPGDLLAVTGRLGLAAAGLCALEHAHDAPELTRAHHRPTPRIKEGQWLAARPDVHAMIDISDGLVQDAGHLAEAGEVGVDIDPALLRPAPALARYCDEHSRDPVSFMLSGGEDYELAFAISMQSAGEILEAFRAEFHTGIATVGAFTGAWPGVRVGGKPPSQSGFDHFR